MRDWTRTHCFKICVGPKSLVVLVHGQVASPSIQICVELKPLQKQKADQLAISSFIDLRYLYFSQSHLFSLSLCIICKYLSA